MNHLREIRSTRVPPELPDADDMEEMDRDIYVLLRQAHREALGRRFSPVGAKKDRGSI